MATQPTPNTLDPAAIARGRAEVEKRIAHDRELLAEHDALRTQDFRRVLYRKEAISMREELTALTAFLADYDAAKRDQERLRMIDSGVVAVQPEYPIVKRRGETPEKYRVRFCPGRLREVLDATASEIEKDTPTREGA